MGEVSRDALIFRHLATEKPNEKQIEFFKSKAKYICYGGARGGGKSWAMRRKFVMLAMHYDGLKLLLLRRTMPELRENHIIPLKSELYGYATYREDEKTFVFPNGSRLKLGYCDNENDKLQYQGQEYEVIGFEEATNFQEDWIRFISTCARTTRTDFKPRIYYTANPGGVSHSYIKRLFVDKIFNEKEDANDYVFIPAKIWDNKVLMEANPDYVKNLESLPEQLRKAHLYGDWNIYEGQVFEEFRNDPEHYKDRINTHVIEPFEIPHDWKIYRSFDFGYSKPFSVGYYAVDHENRAYRILEYYGCTDTPNTGIKIPPTEIFKNIKEIESQHRWLKDKHITGIADPAIWEASSGESIAETGEKMGVYFEPGDHKRLAGLMQFHYRLAFDENGIPMFYVFKTCKNFIRTIPQLQYDEHKVEDIDSDMEDHIYDECRYFFMARPMNPIQKVDKKHKEYNPLDLDDTRYDQYEFYRTM